MCFRQYCPYLELYIEHKMPHCETLSHAEFQLKMQLLFNDCIDNLTWLTRDSL